MDLHIRYKNGRGRGRRSVSDASGGKFRGLVEGTNLDTGGFVQLVRFHIYNLTCLTIDTPRMFSICMFCLE